VEKYPWLQEAERAGHDAVTKLKARPIEPGKYDLVLDSLAVARRSLTS
jgi:predicted Zn-dependent protease